MAKRRSRESFTRVLERISQRLNSGSSYELSWNVEFINHVVYSRFSVRALWVAGSYARGSLECGDLDLVMEIVLEEGTFPTARKISRLVLGHAPDVRLYLGTPSANTSGIEFTEAKSVWSVDGPDWAFALKNIPADHTATRFERRHDILPFRQEQLRLGGLAELDDLVIQQESGLISWRWIPAEEVRVDRDAWCQEARELFARAERSIGKKTKAVMELAINWLQDRDRGGTWERNYRDNCHFKACGTEVFLGFPPVPIDLLDSLSCSHLLIAPHLSRRGPNGLWLISRGGNHPAVRVFEHCTAYCEMADDRPVFCFESSRWRDETAILDLFSSIETAKRKISEYSDDDDFCPEIRLISDNDLLETISFADVVTLSGMTDGLISEEAFAITRKGAASELYFDDEDSKCAQVAELSSSIRSALNSEPSDNRAEGVPAVS